MSKSIKISDKAFKAINKEKARRLISSDANSTTKEIASDLIIEAANSKGDK